MARPSDAPSASAPQSSLVRKTLDGDIAVLTLDSPPVNALGAALRRDIAARIREISADKAIKAIVLIGSDRFFSGGGDIGEFDGPIPQPDMPAVVALVEACEKPIVVGIGGTCMGGGLELAMAAHYRIAHVKSLLALPETKIGLIPGAGGTQRLPRALGLEKALDLILKGKTFTPRELAGTPLIDRVTEGDLLSDALDYARTLVAENAPPRRLRDLAVASNSPPAEILESARQSVADKAERFPALPSAIDCLENSLTVPIDEAQLFERRRFLELRDTPTARALRYAFFAERIAGKIPGLAENLSPRPIGSVGIVGAGTMGRGICVSFLNADLPVMLVDSQADALQQAVAAIRGILENDLKKGRLSEAAFGKRIALLATSTEFANLGKADLVVEAVHEDIGVKEAVFRRLDQVTKSGAILATNTSTLDVDRIAAVTGRPQDVIGMHFFSPANIMKLVEIVRAEKTSDDVLATVMKLARSIGKIAIVSGVCDGFIGNRMLEHYVRMAHLMVEEGALPWQIDHALEAWGMSMGPFRMGDLAGNDIGWAIRKRRYAERPHVRYARIADALCEKGRFGQKTGSGWYAYRDGSRTPEPDSGTVRIIEDYRATKGIVPRAIEDEEIVARCVLALVNEGARIVEEGIAFRASDIDVAYLNGYGFPRFRGGPMKYADQRGLPDVVAAMERFRDASGDSFWEPAALLRRAAESEGSLTGGP